MNISIQVTPVDIKANATERAVSLSFTQENTEGAWVVLRFRDTQNLVTFMSTMQSVLRTEQRRLLHELGAYDD